MMNHIDLFSGIGGFALAAERVWPGIEHVFCDNDKFCQAVLKKHWPDAKIYGDIRAFTNTNIVRPQESRTEQQTGRNRQDDKTHESTSNTESRESGEPSERKGRKDTGGRSEEGTFILTGGFPCQPFSQAGRRKGTSDNRYLWPEMLRVIREFKPTWVIGENVAGITTMVQYESEAPVDEEGNAIGEIGDTRDFLGRFVAKEIVESLEKEGYAVQVFIIPAVAVNAPHRRDRVWFIGHAKSDGCTKRHQETGGEIGKSEEGRMLQSSGASRACDAPDTGCQCREQRNGNRMETNETKRTARPTHNKRCGEDAPDTTDRRCGQCSPIGETKADTSKGHQRNEWQRNWIEVATELCSVDDGLPVELGGLKLTKSGNRREQLKAYGNAIVPQVAEHIMRAIKETM